LEYDIIWKRDAPAIRAVKTVIFLRRPPTESTSFFWAASTPALAFAITRPQTATEMALKV